MTIRAITFQNGHTTSYGGGIYAYTAAVVDVKLCLFINCQSTSTYSSYGGGAIYASTAILNVYGTSFSGNMFALGAGNDIKASSATITIHATCPVPYSHVVAAQGK
jgi:predicted outer membrane repeat protein